MRQTKYVPGYGYVTGSGFWQDAGKELTYAIGKRVASAVGDKVGRKIAEKIIPKEKVMKELDELPNGLPEDVRKALYGSGVKNKKYLI